MKKLLSVMTVTALALLCILCLSACANSVDEKMFTFEKNGIEITLGENAKPVLEALGEPMSKNENGNCGGKGLSTTYTYNGFVLSTLTAENGKETIDQIDFTNDVTETPKGIYLGMNAQRVIDAYGEPTKKDSRTYEYSAEYSSTEIKYLAFDIDSDGNVKAITYGIKDKA